MSDGPGRCDQPAGPADPEPASPDPQATAGETWRERTALAWIRTTLAMAGTGLLCVRLAPSRAVTALSTAVVFAATALVLHNARTLRGRRRTRRHGRDAAAGRDQRVGRPGGPVPDPRLLLLTAVVTISIGLVGLAFAFG